MQSFFTERRGDVVVVLGPVAIYCLVRKEEEEKKVVSGISSSSLLMRKRKKNQMFFNSINDPGAGALAAPMNIKIK